MDKPYIPDKWKNLRLEIDDDYKDDDCKIYEPRIVRTESIIKYDSILKNKKDVFKENHKRCDDDCYNSKHKLNFKCVIL